MPKRCRYCPEFQEGENRSVNDFSTLLVKLGKHLSKIARKPQAATIIPETPENHQASNELGNSNIRAGSDWAHIYNRKNWWNSRHQSIQFRKTPVHAMASPLRMSA